MSDVVGVNDAPGNTPIDPDELVQLIPSLATKQELDEWERKNIIDARTWALSPRTVGSRDPFVEPYLRELHRRMFDQTWKWAGKYRKTEKNIGCTVPEIANRLGALLGDARYWAEHDTYPPDEIAVRFHHRLVGTIHPFPNGNGRHARLHADVIAVKLGRAEFTWGRNDLVGAGPARARYLDALRALDADDRNVKPLLEFARS